MKNLYVSLVICGQFFMSSCAHKSEQPNFFEFSETLTVGEHISSVKDRLNDIWFTSDGTRSKKNLEALCELEKSCFPKNLVDVLTYSPSSTSGSLRIDQSAIHATAYVLGKIDQSIWIFYDGTTGTVAGWSVLQGN